MRGMATSRLRGPQVLEQAVRETLAKCRRGEIAADAVELFALQVVCSERGAPGAVRAIQRFLRERGAETKPS
jgi:hypothetical protein